MSRIDKSIVESIVIDWFRNVTSKEKSRWVCDEIESGCRCVRSSKFEVRSEQRSWKEEERKSSASTKLEVWTNRPKMIVIVIG